MRHAPRTFWLGILGLCLLSIPLTAAEPGPKSLLTQVSITPTRVEWLPLADARHLVLTVAGPDGFYIERKLPSGEAPSFSALDFQDNRLPDGVYVYELRADGAPAQSGHLWVQNGRFVDRVPADLKPPIRNITAQEEVIADNLVVEGRACIGSDCVAGDGDDATAPLHINEFGNHRIVFDGGCCYPSEQNWSLQAGDASAPSGDFLIRDLSAGTIPIRIGANAPSNALSILYNGNIGLGTATPAERLHVFSSADANSIITSENSSTGTSAAGVVRSKSNAATVNLIAHGSGRTLSRFGQTLGSWSEILQTDGNGLILGTLSDKPVLMGTNSAEHVRIDSDGDVGINCNNPTSDLVIASSSGCSTPTSSINAGSSQFTVSSSRTLKENLAPVQVPGLLDRIAGVNVFTYDFINGPKGRLGLMAEDFHKVLGRGSDKVIDGQDVEMTLWLAVQELTAQNKQLKGQNDEITKRLAELEARLAVTVPDSR